MAKKHFKVELLILLSIMVFFLFGCVTSIGIPNISSWSKEATSIGKEEYSVLGPVKLEKKNINVLGIFGRGGVLYADLLSKAQERYFATDAVIYVNVETKVSNYVFFVTIIEYTITGIAISFEKGIGTIASTSMPNQIISNQEIKSPNEKNIKNDYWVCGNCSAMNIDILTKCTICLKNRR